MNEEKDMAEVADELFNKKKEKPKKKVYRFRQDSIVEKDEEPAGLRLKVKTKKGFVGEFTYKDKTGIAVLKKIPTIEKEFELAGIKPVIDKVPVKVVDKEEKKKDYCEMHDIEMRRWEKGDRVWYSHFKEFDGERVYCSGKGWGK